MKLGVVFPQTEIGDDVAILRDYVQTAEGLGYDYLVAYDHVIGANPNRPGGWSGPYTHETAFHEPFVTFAYMAAITERIEFTTSVIILPQRQTVLVAKQAAQLDLLCGGRLRLGIGIGWNTVEYESLNENFKNRGKRLEEQVTVLRELWTKPLVTFKGQYHTINDAGLKPLPVQRPIPLWFGGGGADTALRRIAQLADGWMPNALPPEKFHPLWENLKEYLYEAGRDPNTFGLDVRVTLKNHPKSEWAEQVKYWQALGVTHLSINTMAAGFNPRQHIETIREFKEMVLPS